MNPWRRSPLFLASSGQGAHKILKISLREDNYEEFKQKFGRSAIEHGVGLKVS